jgi:hypothetical protein
MPWLLTLPSTRIRTKPLPSVAIFSVAAVTWNLEPGGRVVHVVAHRQLRAALGSADADLLLLDGSVAVAAAQGSGDPRTSGIQIGGS